MNITEFIDPNLYILVVFLWQVGLFLKKAKAFKQEWSIPLILLAISIVITVPYISIILKQGFSVAAVMNGIIQGTLIQALSVFGNEIAKQSIVKRPQDSISKEVDDEKKEK